MRTFAVLVGIAIPNKKGDPKKSSNLSVLAFRHAREGFEKKGDNQSLAQGRYIHLLLKNLSRGNRAKIALPKFVDPQNSFLFQSSPAYMSGS